MLKNNLSKIMGEKRIRIFELQKLTGISRSTLTRLYYEKSNSIHFDHLEKLCDVLECSVGELFVFNKCFKN